MPEFHKETSSLASVMIWHAPCDLRSCDGAGPIAFVKLLEDWRAAGTLEGLEVTRS